MSELISDVLIGWHIESDENGELQKSIANAFVSFKQFWISDISYPISLVMQVWETVSPTPRSQIVGEQWTSGYTIFKGSKQTIYNILWYNQRAIVRLLLVRKPRGMYWSKSAL